MRSKHLILTAIAAVAAASLIAACSDSTGINPLTTTGSGGQSATSTGPSTSTNTSTSSSGQGGSPDVTVKGVCKLPGSRQYLGSSVHVVAGGLPTCQAGETGHCQSDLSFLKLPTGFCAHWFGNVGNTRQVRFAPGGELFVASPTTTTTGGGAGGLSSIVVLPDDDKDGYADKQLTFLKGLPSTQGMLFANDHFYFQNHTQIRRVPYVSGDRTPSGASEEVVNVSVFVSDLHWPKTFDIADDGTIYLANGGNQDESCESAHPFHGGILKVPSDGSKTPIQVAKGFRNPIAIRCAKGKNRCFAAELALDFSDQMHGREKIVPIRQGDDWGFPCCATANQPYSPTEDNPNCGDVATDKDSFFIGDTPFGLAFQTPAKPWPAPWDNLAIVTLHGAAGSWAGARVAAISVDPSTGLLAPGTNIHGDQDQGSLKTFASGWDDHSLSHGRPAAVDFSADGRLFLGNDNNGDIIWIAPLDF